MSLATGLFVFVLGAALGSFINVLALRYTSSRGFSPAFRGRSKCPKCKKGLAWYELIPVISFIIQLGRCRGCRKGISLQYPVVEFIAGILVWGAMSKVGVNPIGIVWSLALLTLLLISIVDLRTKLIPDSLVLTLVGLGIASIIFRYLTDQLCESIPDIEGINLLGHYSLILRFGMGQVINHIAAILVGLLFFGGLYSLSGGRGMGFGDVKLIGALGTLIMWPDIILVLVLPFIIGSIFGLFMMIFRGMAFKSTLPFGPFIALGVILVFFFGYDITNGYFTLFNIF